MSVSGSEMQPLVVVTGADENYSIGLAVTVQSMLHHLDSQRRVELYVLDGGITAATRQRLLKSWDDPRVRLHWVAADMQSLSHLVTAGHLNHTTYLRLLIPAILPPDVDKALYLDSDLLIRRDVGLLWDEPLDGHAVLAGQETGCPYVDSEVVFADQPSKYRGLGTTTPIRNYRQLGMDPRAKVFNAGILVINVDYWRKHDVPQQALDCLEQHREHVLFCDQYALNVVLAKAWRELDTRWNQTAQFYVYRSLADSPFDSHTYDLLQNDPWICHFTYIYKPWLQGCEHPFAEEFVEQMRRTAWVDHQLAPNPALVVTPEEVQQAKELHRELRRQRTWGQWLQRRRDKLRARLQHRFPQPTGHERSDRRAA